ncbi:MAG: hypothetical protein WC455_01695 [Dehalococcoidia bacterium]|jgi:cytochrome c
MKPSERIEQIAKNIKKGNSPFGSDSDAPRLTDYLFAIIEYLDENQTTEKPIRKNSLQE